MAKAKSGGGSGGKGGAIRSLYVSLVAQTTEWEKGLKKATKKVEEFSSEVAKSTKEAGSHFLGLKSAIGVVAGAATLGALTAGVLGAIDRIDQLGDAAGQLGTTAEALSKLNYIFDLSGSSAADGTNALQKYIVNLGKAADATDPFGKALTSLGIDAEKQAKLPLDLQLRAVIEGFEKLPGGADRAAKAVELFGKSGTTILNTLSQGTKGFDALSQEARDFGQVLSNLDVAGIGLVKDSIDKIRKAFDGVFNTLAVKLAPYIKLFADKFTDLLKSLDGGRKIDLLIDGVAHGIAALIDGAVRLKIAFQDAIGATLLGLEDLLKALASAVSGLGPLIGQDKVDPLFRTLRLASAEVGGLGEKMRLAAKDALGLFGLNRPSRGFLESLKGMKDAFRGLSEEGAKAAADAAGGGLGNAELLGDIQELTDKFRDQRRQIGLNADGLEVFKLKARGATEEQLRGLREVARENAAAAKDAKRLDRAKDFAKGLAEDIKTPFEKLRDQFAKIKQAALLGLIDPGQAARARHKAVGEAGLGEVKLAGAVETRSSAGYSAIVQALSGRSGFNVLADIQRQGNAILGRIDQGIGRVAAIHGRPQGLDPFGED